MFIKRKNTHLDTYWVKFLNIRYWKMLYRKYCVSVQGLVGNLELSKFHSISLKRKFLRLKEITCAIQNRKGRDT